MKSQYNNISVLKLKQLSKTNQSESNMDYKHSLSDCRGSQVMTAVKCGPPCSPKIEKGDYRWKKRKKKLLSMVLDIARLCCKSIRKDFI